MPRASGKKATPRRAPSGAKAQRGASKKATKATKATRTTTKSAKKVAKKAPAPRKAKASAPAKKAPAKKVPPKKAKASAPVKKAPAKKAPPKKVPAKAAAPKPSAPKPSAPSKKAAQAAPDKAAPAKATGARKKTVICELSGFEVTPSAPNLSPKTLDRLREKLVTEKSRLEKQASELAAEADQLAREREAGDTQFDEESGEGDTVNVERERDLLLSASARSVVEEIDDAITRIKKGTYGVCKYAGRRLPLERLEALPWADDCVECRARAARRR